MNKSIIILPVLAINLLIAVSSCNSDNKALIVGLNQNIHHDDFEYSVTDFKTIRQISAERDTVFAQGTFYLVNFKVVNNALRVDHQWNNSIAYIVDKNGNRYENIEEDQALVNKTLPFGLKKIYNTTHGSSDSAILVFDIPSDVREPYLMVRGDILMGDAFEGGKFRKMKIRLF